MPLLVIVVIDSFAYIVLISDIACPAGGVSHINISSCGAGVLPCLRLAVVPLLLSSSLLIEGFAGGRGVWSFWCKGGKSFSTKLL